MPMKLLKVTTLLVVYVELRSWTEFLKRIALLYEGKVLDVVFPKDSEIDQKIRNQQFFCLK
jgi:hypothetical protein